MNIKEIIQKRKKYFRDKYLIQKGIGVTGQDRERPNFEEMEQDNNQTLKEILTEYVKWAESKTKVIPIDKTDNGRMKEEEWDYAEGFNSAIDTLLAPLKEIIK